CLTWCCPCIAFGRISEIVDKGSSSCLMYMGFPCLISLLRLRDLCSLSRVSWIRHDHRMGWKYAETESESGDSQASRRSRRNDQIIIFHANLYLSIYTTIILEKTCKMREIFDVAKPLAFHLV
ncbi:uncharacterized protein LOC121770868, partial [Salvia splendens]|uniref:uncharacterized protein LOC121770868 n=1 Tax=Salvia splendens TaxID=180675 RepID=UPI001C27FE95